MSFKDNLKRGRATLGIIAVLGGARNVDVLKDANTAVNKQYGAYVKDARLPATRRDIQRTLDNATRARSKPTTSLDSRSLKKLR